MERTQCNGSLECFLLLESGKFQIYEHWGMNQWEVNSRKIIKVTLLTLMKDSEAWVCQWTQRPLEENLLMNRGIYTYILIRPYVPYKYICVSYLYWRNILCSEAVKKT